MPRVNELRQVAPVRWLFPAAALVLLGVGAAHAQTSPPTVLPTRDEVLPVPGLLGPQIPSIPPPTVPTPTPPRPGAAEPGAPERPPVVSKAVPPRAWTFSMGLGVGWDENIDASVANGPSSWAGVLSARLSYLHYRPNGQIRVSAGGSATGYRDFHEYNRPNGGGSVDGRWRLARDVDASLSAGYAYGHTDNSDWLMDQGLLYPLSPMQTYTGSARLSWRVAGRTSMYADARGVRTDFESAGLSTSNSARVSVGLDQAIGKRDSLGLESAWERAWEPEQLETLFASAQWRHTLTPRTGIFLEGGVSWTTGSPPDKLARGNNFFGGASLSRQIGGKSIINAGYRREVVPVFGIGGARLVDRFNLAFSATLGRSWLAGFGATYALESDPASGGSFSTVYSDASLGRRLGRYWSLSVAGRYRRGETAAALREAYRVGAYLSWEPTAR